MTGTSANDLHFQAFLIEGIFRWNQDREAAVTSTDLPSYDTSLLHSVNRLSAAVLGEPLFPAFKVPRKYTGELFGLEYLYAQTGKALQTVTDDDSEKAEDEDDDEGFEVRYFDKYIYNK